MSYKAIIKDDQGIPLSDLLIVIQFGILQSDDQTLVYSELHTPTTDANGLIFLNIGEGTVLNGTYASINWASDTHFLNVQVNSGNGLVDLGTTQFLAVPYAISAQTAKNVNGLEAIDEGDGIGWRLVDSNPNFYGSIGFGAVDLSRSTSNGLVNGATGQYAFAIGFNNRASGSSSFVGGENNITSGAGAVAFGTGNVAAGITSFVSGISLRTDAFMSTAFGTGNIGGGDPDSWVLTDPLFEIGNSPGPVQGNAVTVLKNGNTGIGTSNPQERLHVANGRLRIGSETVEDTGSNRLEWNTSLFPDTDDSFQLGSSALRWRAVWATDGTINTSDRREKRDIQQLNYGLREILDLNPVRFRWKAKPEQGEKLGLIAQDVLEIIPEVVKTHEYATTSDDEDATLEKKKLDRLGVYYNDLIPVLIKAIQEQQQLIDQQNKKIDLLSQQTMAIAKLQERIVQLEQNNQ
ncbi:hypothetical protein GCM10011344_00390 [Dokdonia pacifica]|nr:tail fiber domain-containing protein [Dokdonia pacifica]GGG03976.1 hypothetical protein GCM10011344_00390 [Dokdonia pacifica]